MNDNNNNGLGNNNTPNNEVPVTPERPRVEILTPSSPDVLDAFRIGDTIFEVPANPNNFAEQTLAPEVPTSTEVGAPEVAETPVATAQQEVVTPVAPTTTFTQVPTQQAADVAAGIDGRTFLSANESAETFMENGYAPLKPAEMTSVPTQQAADVAAGIGRDFKDANESAQAFIENGYTPMKPVEHTSISTQEAADRAAGIDGRDFISATESARAFEELGLTDYEKQLIEEEQKNNVPAVEAPIVTSVPTQQAADVAAGIGRDFKDANESAQAFIENGYTPMKPVEHTSISTQEAADRAAGIDGRDFISATESARAFEELGLTDYEKQLAEAEQKNNVPAASAPASSVETSTSAASSGSGSIKTEELGGIFTPVFMSTETPKVTSVPTQQAADAAAGIGRDFKDANESAQAFIENGQTPMKPAEVTSVPTQQAADAAAGIGRDFKDANESAQAFIENGQTPMKPAEVTSVPTQQAADIAAGIGRDFKDATESAQAFIENGQTPMKPAEFTSIPTQQAADIAAGIDGRTFKSATESAQAIIEDDKQKMLAAVQRQKEQEEMGVAAIPVPVPAKLGSMPDDFMVDTPLEKGEILLERIRNGEIDKEEWMAIYENEMKKAQAAKLAAIAAAAAAAAAAAQSKPEEEEDKDKGAIVAPIIPPVAGGTNGIDKTEEEKERLTPVVVFKKAKDSLVEKLKNKKNIVKLAATLALIIALAHSCTAPMADVQKEDIPEQPGIVIQVDKDKQQVQEPTVQTPEQKPVVQTPVQKEEEKAPEQTQTQTPEQKPEQKPEQTPTTPTNPTPPAPQTPTTPTPPAPPAPETPAQTLPEEKVPGFEIVNNQNDDEVKLRTQEQYNDQAGSTVKLDENGEEKKQLSGEFFEITTESGKTIRTDSEGQTFMDGEYVGSVGTEDQVVLPDRTEANVVNLPEEVNVQTPEEPEVPVAFVVQSQSDFDVVNQDSFAAAQAAVAAGFLDQNPSDLTPEQVAQAYVDHMANNPVEDVTVSQGLGK